MSLDYGCCVQEQTNRKEIGDLESQLQLSEALVADFQKTPTERFRAGDTEVKAGPS